MRLKRAPLLGETATANGHHQHHPKPGEQLTQPANPTQPNPTQKRQDPPPSTKQRENHRMGCRTCTAAAALARDDEGTAGGGGAVGGGGDRRARGSSVLSAPTPRRG